MNITPEQLEQIVKDAVAAGVKAAIEKEAFVCACGLSAPAQKELGHFMGVIKHLGGDDDAGYAKGAEVFRKNSEFVVQWRSACEKTGSLILRTIVIGIIGSMLVVGSLGLKEWFKKGGP